MRLRLALASLAASACGATPPSPTAGPDRPGTLAVEWSGSHTGGFAAPATASWCAADSLVEILAVQGDTGVGLTLLVPDSLRPTNYPAFAPEIQVDWRPLATAALRWFASSEVLGFESVSGVVGVTAVAAGASGTIDVRLKAATGLDTLHLTGRFTAVTVEPSRGPCGRISKRTAR